MAKPRMMFFHDGRHPHIYMHEPPMQKEEYAVAIDELSGTTIDAVMFCLGEGRTFLHDTQVGELWGHNVDKWPHLIWRRTHQNAKGLGSVHTMRIGVIIGEWNSHKTSTNASILSYQYSVEM